MSDSRIEALALKLKEDEGAVYRMLGEALPKLGRKEEAKETYRNRSCSSPRSSGNGGGI